MLGFLGRAAQTEQLRHELGLGAQRLSIDDMLRAAHRLDVRARKVRTTAARLARYPLPAIARLADGEFVLLLQADDERVLLLSPGEGAPRTEPIAAFAAVFGGELVLMTTREQVSGAARAFDISWHRRRDGGRGDDHRRRGGLRADAGKLDELLHPMLDPKADKKIIARGLPASPGAAVGKVVFHADDAVAEAQKGERVVLVRVETSPEDIHGMTAAQGILTARGGMTSHAAVVARGMGKCCVAGAGAINVDYAKAQMSVNVDGKPVVVKKGDVLSLDGAKGEVILGAVPMSAPALDDDYEQLMKWVDERRAAARCAPTPTRRPTRRPRATTAPRASACAAPSTCSSPRTASSRCAR